MPDASLDEKRWNHCLCEKCYFGASSAIPRRMPPDPDTCCRCGRPTRSGIFIRANPNAMACKGVRGTHVHGAAAR